MTIRGGVTGLRKQGATRRTRETAGELAARAARTVERLSQLYPHVECALTHSSDYELLVATILSAQCTDERVNSVTPRLFAAYPTVQTLAESEQVDVEAIIKSLGFFRAKAKHLRGMAAQVVERFAGRIPQSLDDLITLPGVGRKTANVLLGTWHGIPSGVVVDTHVRRISRLLGLTRQNDPERIEEDLNRLLPDSEWINFSHRLIWHGRGICIARRPQCQRCPLLPDCRRVGLPPLTDHAGSG